MNNNNYNPDIMECLADLSNDEVQTPPKLAKKMVDMLPEHLFKNPESKFLDPFSKSGIFLRVIVEKLIIGLENVIKDRDERVEHILKNMVFGYSITSLTGKISRRTVYCAKNASSEDSIVRFSNEEGNIKYLRSEHNFKNGACSICGINDIKPYNSATQENYAYSFIHNLNEIKEITEMKFDVIIGNPPYQLSDGTGGLGSSATPIYQHFVEQAKNLNPRFISMIIPSRWFTGGKGLDKFRESMISDDKIRVLHDFVNAGDCFPSVEIKGGVCYFLWDRDNPGDCLITTHNSDGTVVNSTRKLKYENNNFFLRYESALSILEKTKNNGSFSNIVSSRNPFGLISAFTGYHTVKDSNSVPLYKIGEIAYVYKNQIAKSDLQKGYKVYIAKAIGKGDIATDKIKPILGTKDSVCTETYLHLGPFKTQYEAKNVISFINTKFFHALLAQKKITHNMTKDSFQLIPLVNFNESWDDKKLYKKFKLSKDEIDFIEKSVWPEKKSK